MSAKTSVIIPCYNVADKVGLQLQALVQQEENEPFEVVLVNNKSTDDLVSAVAPYEGKLNIRIIDAFEHAGVSYARNVGVGAARGDYLIFCDGDDVVSPHFVAHGQKALKSHPIYAAGFVPVDTSKFLSVESALAGIEEATFEAPRDEWQDDMSWPILPGCAFGIRRATMLQVGGFDLSVEPGAEDNDFGIRAAQEGYFPGIIRSAVIAYRVYPAGQRSYRSAFYRAKSVALLLHYTGKWSNNPVTQGRNPALILLKVLAAGAKTFIADRSALKEWRNRFSQANGIFQGWVQYELLKQAPERQIGIGLKF